MPVCLPYPVGVVGPKVHSFLKKNDKTIIELASLFVAYCMVFNICWLSSRGLLHRSRLAPGPLRWRSGASWKVSQRILSKPPSIGVLIELHPPDRATNAISSFSPSLPPTDLLIELDI
ncbi:hypothetical protein K505DRAFT_90763 [Melanomma pulvis-pyrius CBS 109.77]|uniref:Uncharacterized protein n=1 Tax=Melanomma pulvis-pyrius CBS 109.77 TaxID=1314802 RepID=A0A6A6WZZ9_9PLEO|nr:hypothetical protein K505DRAFT_90763 [Melanomma pulvis-pyrius CBS 109.77]